MSDYRMDERQEGDRRNLDLLSSRVRSPGEDPDTAQDGGMPDASAPLAGSKMLVLSASAAMVVANVYYSQPLLQPIAQSYGLSQSAAGSISTVSQVGYCLGLVFIVPLGDIMDQRSLLIRLTLALAAALVATAFAPTSIILFVSMLAVGALCSVTQVFVTYSAFLARPFERGAVVGKITSGIILGILLARTISGFLMDIAGWRSIFLGSAAAMIIVALSLLGLLPKLKCLPPATPYRSLVKSVFVLWYRERALQIRGFLGFLIFAAITVLWTSLSLPLRDSPYHMSYSEIGLFGLVGAAGASAAAFAGRWADKGLSGRGTFLSLSLMLFAWLPIALLPYSITSLLVGIVMIDFGIQGAHVLNQAMIFQTRPLARSRLAAAYMIAYAFGCAFGSAISTYAYDAAGWNGVCFVGATISLLALLFWAVTLKSINGGMTR